MKAILEKLVERNMKTILENITTSKLVEELRKREGIKSIDVKPYEEYFVDSVNNDEQEAIEETGPAIILIITD